MTDNDEKELHRLCDMLKEVDECLDANSPLREAVSKGALALSLGFIHGFRSKLEDLAQGIGQPLTESQKAQLFSNGIETQDTSLTDAP